MSFALQGKMADHFVGRVEELQQLHQYFSTRHATASPAVALILGPGGVGKTCLAWTAAARLSDYFPYGVLYLNSGDFAGASNAIDIARKVLRDVAQRTASSFSDSTLPSWRAT